MATRKLKITHVAYIGGLHSVLVGQLRLPLGRAGRKPLGSRAPGTASRCFTEREPEPERAHFPEASRPGGGHSRRLPLQDPERWRGLILLLPSSGCGENRPRELQRVRVGTLVKQSLWRSVSYGMWREWGGSVEAASSSSPDSRPTSLGAFLWPPPGDRLLQHRPTVGSVVTMVTGRLADGQHSLG